MSKVGLKVQKKYLLQILRCDPVDKDWKKTERRKKNDSCSHFLLNNGVNRNKSL